MRRLLLRSPPRMRGKDGVNDSAQAVTGITPACAGKSMVRRSDSRRSQGSPPRMRGKGCIDVQAVHAPGITPAYAGKSLRSMLLLYLHWDHPRVCGEKRGRVCGLCHREGSPPRMRGKGLCKGFHLCDVGITPAYAGKS